MFNKKKKMIKKLESEITDLKILNSELMRKNENLKAELSGEHIGSHYCSVCEYGVADQFGVYVCSLECKCKDFVRNGSSAF